MCGYQRAWRNLLAIISMNCAYGPPYHLRHEHVNNIGGRNVSTAETCVDSLFIMFAQYPCESLNIRVIV